MYLPRHRRPPLFSSFAAPLARPIAALAMTFGVLLAPAGCVESTSPDPTTPDPTTPDPTTPDPTPTHVDANDADTALRLVASDLEAPWSVAFAPGEADASFRAFVTERDRGVVSEIDPTGEPGPEGRREVRRFEVDASGEAGLLGIAASPDFARDGLLYVYFTGPDDNRVVRFSVDGDDAPEAILTGIPKDAIHNGGRIAFGPDGMLYVGTGDTGRSERARRLDSLAGKILRLTPDGQVPDDNPFEGSPVWSLGHRNVQGLAWDARGELYATEFGPDRDDEINHIEPGADYGWPEVTGRAGREGIADPVVVKQPQVASWSGATFVVDGAIEAFEGDLLVASLRGERLWRFTLTDSDEIGEEQALVAGELGRLRAVVQAPDGALWLLTNNRDGRGRPRPGDDRIFRIGP